MWIRRIISLVVLAALCGLLIFLVSRGFQNLGNLLSTHQENTNASTQQEPVEIVDCTEKDIDLTTMVTPATMAVGSQLQMNVTITNVGKVTCLLKTELLNIELLTGDYQVWNPTACDSSWEKQLLLVPEKAWSTSFTWNGGIYQACDALKNDGSEAQLIAEAGTYRLRSQLDGAAIGSESVLVIQ